MEEVTTSILVMLAQSGVTLLLDRRLVSLLLGELVGSEDKLLQLPPRKRLRVDFTFTCSVYLNVLFRYCLDLYQVLVCASCCWRNFVYPEFEFLYFHN